MSRLEQKSPSEQQKTPSTFQEVYPIQEPHVYAAIAKEPQTQKIHYSIIEPTLAKEETQLLKEVKTLLMEEMDVNMKELGTRDKAGEYLRKKVLEIIKDYRLRVPKEAIDKLLYYITRDYIGYGKIDALMKDHMIEDISADGVAIPIYIWHRVYESLPTNITFENEDELNSFVVRLAYLAGKNVSLASPMLDASLPDGSRVQLTYGSEITRKGSTFTIRRFRVDPLTIADLIALNTLSCEMAAYFWYVIEHRASVIVAGGVAAGKTTTLNCLSMFIKPELKVVSVEDTAELNLPHENWIPSVVRSGFGFEEKGAITLFDLLKAAVRQRPDYIIVGEVRGEEAYTLFQAMATGHLGMSTIHAESVETVVNRLKSEPMNIPLSLLGMIDNIVVQARTEVDGKPQRRIVSVAEVASIDHKRKEAKTNEIYHWNPKDDSFSSMERSCILEKCIQKIGISEEDARKEIQRRQHVLEWLVKSNIRKYTDVAAVIREYYANPDRTYRKARLNIK